MVAKAKHRRKQKPKAKARLREALRAAKAKGVKPIVDFDKFLEEVGDAWPKDESIDEFITWLHRARRTGKYS